MPTGSARCCAPGLGQAPLLPSSRPSFPFTGSAWESGGAPGRWWDADPRGRGRGWRATRHFSRDRGWQTRNGAGGRGAAGTAPLQTPYLFWAPAQQKPPPPSSPLFPAGPLLQEALRADPANQRVPFLQPLMFWELILIPSFNREGLPWRRPQSISHSVRMGGDHSFRARMLFLGFNPHL